MIENNKIIRRRCRLYGYDSPELSNKNTKKEAEAAKEYLKTLLPRITPFVSRIEGFDKYGRLLICPQTQEKEISSIMIENGHGVEYFGGKKNINVQSVINP
jgi:endonuclease YncB( thermonuclease family)